MRKLLTLSLIAIAALCLLNNPQETVLAQSAREILPLQLEEQIPVPGVAGRLDHFTADAKRKRLFVSALGNNTVEVIDVFSGKVIHSIKGLAQPQGPLYVPDVDKLYVANAEDGKLRVYDGGTYALRKTIDFGADPDNVRYDAASKKIFVGFGEDDGGIAMVDPLLMNVWDRCIKQTATPSRFRWKQTEAGSMPTSRMQATWWNRSMARLVRSPSGR